MHWLGHYEEAEQAFRASLEVYTTLVGPDHPEVAQCHNNLAASLIALGRADEAEPHVQRALEIWEASGGHSHLAGGYDHLGDIALAREDYVQALAMFERAHTMMLEVFGPDHPTTIGALTSIANAQLQLDRYDAAELHLNDSNERLSAVVGAEHPNVLAIRLSLAELAHLRGHDLEALAQLDALALAAASTGADGRHYLLASMLMQAEIERSRGRFDQAHAVLARVDELFEDGVDEQLRTLATKLRAELPTLAPVP